MVAALSLAVVCDCLGLLAYANKLLVVTFKKANDIRVFLK